MSFAAANRARAQKRVRQRGIPRGAQPNDRESVLRMIRSLSPNMVHALHWLHGHHLTDTWGFWGAIGDWQIRPRTLDALLRRRLVIRIDPGDDLPLLHQLSPIGEYICEHHMRPQRRDA